MTYVKGDMEPDPWKSTSTSEGPLILFADDDSDTRELVSFGLGRMGYRVVFAGDGDEALRLARTWRPALVILDVMMPGLDGYEVTRELRSDEETRRLPIMMLTARTHEADVRRGLELGADVYLRKPFAIGELGRRVRELLQPV